MEGSDGSCQTMQTPLHEEFQQQCACKLGPRLALTACMPPCVQDAAGRSDQRIQQWLRHLW